MKLAKERFRTSLRMSLNENKYEYERDAKKQFEPTLHNHRTFEERLLNKSKKLA